MSPPSRTAPSTNARNTNNTAVRDWLTARNARHDDPDVRASLGSGSFRRAQASTSAAAPVITNAARHDATSARTPAPTEAMAVPRATPTMSRAMSRCRRAAGTVSPM